MKFKNLPGWLKGGIIGGSIPLILYLFLKIILLMINFFPPTQLKILLIYIYLIVSYVFFILPLIPINILFHSDFGNLFVSQLGDSADSLIYDINLLGGAIIILIWFLVGALSGYLINKRRHKR